MKNFSKKINAAIIITMMLVLSFFGAEMVKFGTNLNNTEPQKVANVHSLLAENVTQTTTQVNLGDYITLGKYNGKDIVWRCVSILNVYNYNCVSPSTKLSINMCSPSNTAYENWVIQSPKIMIRVVRDNIKSSSIWRCPKMK